MNRPVNYRPITHYAKLGDQPKTKPANLLSSERNERTGKRFVKNRQSAGKQALLSQTDHSVGVPIQLLSNRPPRLHKHFMRPTKPVPPFIQAFYGRTAMIINPGKWLLSAVGSSLFFNQGANTPLENLGRRSRNKPFVFSAKDAGSKQCPLSMANRPAETGIEQIINRQ